MNKIINSITIVGGGSTGWITAAHLSKNLPEHVKITLIASSEIGTIGVGEGTQPFTTAFLQECGLQPWDWMKEADACFKLGVEFVGWSDHPIFVDNDTQEMAVLGPGIMMHDYVLGKDISKEAFADWTPSYRLAKNNKSPKCGDPRLDFTQGYTTLPWDAYHFNAEKLGEVLKKSCIDKVNYIDDMVVNIETNEDGIAYLETKENGILTADLFIDATGFKSMLLEEALGEEFESLSETLLCNRAIAMPTQYKNKEAEMHPYTKSTAMKCGWRWTIPTFSRIGNGYVYSDKFCTPEEAEQELREAIGDFETPVNHIRMKTGSHKNIAVKNVYATGLSAAFVEPLEATGITFSTKAVQNLTHALLNNNMQYNEQVASWLSNEYAMQVNEIVDFIFLHYHLAPKNDTPFWKAVHEIPLPVSAKSILEKFVNSPPHVLTEKPLFTMFHVGQWFEMIHGFGGYDNKPLGKDVMYDINIETYGDIIWETYSTRTDLEIKLFPNHYQYLKEFYGVK
jgi:tryptophan halogenase